MHSTYLFLLYLGLVYFYTSTNSTTSSNNALSTGVVNGGLCLTGIGNITLIYYRPRFFCLKKLDQKLDVNIYSKSNENGTRACPEIEGLKLIS